MPYEKTVPVEERTLATRDASTVAGASSTAIDSDDAPPGYKFLDELGHGGMGIVYRARDCVFDRDVAVKLLRGEYLANGSHAVRFLEEAKITGQLQHPGIPAVHALGTLPNGRPWLAMKLIRGSSLADLLKSKTPINVLSIFEQIAQAVGYAHAHQVIHRDLKPANVMVGAFGEVQVMDWGLAKVLTQPDAPELPPGLMPISAAGESSVASELRLHRSDLTVDGSVMGTPAYMPPEQALGEVKHLGPATDVFGLGAILCKMLTGKPPYVAEDAVALRILAAGAHLDDAVARLDASAAEPDLIALCKQCLSPLAADRPPNGSAVAVAVASLRSQADDRARQAEIDAATQRKRRVVLAISAAVVGLVLAVGASISGWQWSRAASEQRRTQEALEEVRLERDKTQTAIVSLKAEKKNTVAALKAMTDDVVEELFSSKNDLTAEQKAFLQKIIALYQQATMDRDGSPESRELRADGFFAVGYLQDRLGLLADAETNFRAALALRQALVKEFPDNDVYENDLAWSHNNLGLLYRQTHRFDLAKIELEATQALREKLLARNPGDAECRNEMAGSHTNLGLLFSSMDREDLAEREYTAAQTLLAALVAEFPDNHTDANDLALTYNKLALIYSESGRSELAEASYLKARDLQLLLVTKFPGNVEYLNDLCRIRNNLAIQFDNSGRKDLAEREYRAARDERRSVVEQFPGVPRYKWEHALSYLNLGRFFQDEGRLDFAENEYRAACQLMKDLTDKYPNVPDYISRHAGARLKLADVIEDTDRPELAEREYLTARDLLLPLTGTKTAAANHRLTLGLIRNNFALFLVDQSRNEPAAVEFRGAVELRRSLVVQFPEDSTYRNQLASTLISYARLCNDDRKYANALALLREAEPLHRAALKAYPNSAGIRDAFRDHRDVLLECLVSRGEHAEVPALVRELLDHSRKTDTDYYDTACYLARAMTLASSDVTLNEARRQELCLHYAVEAMRLLHQSVVQGNTDHWWMKSDSDLDPLRGRADFQKLIRDLEAKHPANEPAPLPRKLPR